MRIDGHAHVVHPDWHGEPWWDGVARLGGSILGVPAEAIREGVIPSLWDEDGSGQLGAMDQAGIDVAVMLCYDWTTEEHLGDAPVGWREQNDWYERFAKDHPDRIRWGFGVDPRRDGALEAFEEAVRDRGAIALKLHPCGGFYINDRAVYPFLEKAGELGVPVVFHVGPEPGPLYSKWSDPLLLDEVAADFPDLKLQAAHTGNAAWRETLAVASVKPNVHLDLSGWQVRFRRNPERFYADVREVLDVAGPNRVMWGTDAPYYRTLVSDDDWLKGFEGAPKGMFTEEEMDAVLGGTAAAFYALG